MWSISDTVVPLPGDKKMFLAINVFDNFALPEKRNGIPFSADKNCDTIPFLCTA